MLIKKKILKDVTVATPAVLEKGFVVSACIIIFRREKFQPVFLMRIEKQLIIGPLSIL